MKPSRLLNRLNAAIAASSDQLSSSCLRAERACYQARRGQFDEVKATLKELRQLYESRPNAEISAWLSLAEGLLIHFSDMGPLARDKIHRAYALSAAASITQLNATCAAWLAHMDYLNVDTTKMTRHVHLALTLAHKDNHSALSRASMVVALAYHLAGRLDLARPWYSKAHEHATLEGDDVTVGALMHNMAWLRYANLRRETLRGTIPSANGAHALTSAVSTLQFDDLFGSTSLDASTPILRAQILAIEGHFEEALAAYAEYLVPSVQQGFGRFHAYLLADQAWCRINLGQAQAASFDALAAQPLTDATDHFDERAAAHSRLAQVFSALGDSDSTKRHEELAAVAWKEHERVQKHAVEELNAVARLVQQFRAEH